LKILLVEQSTLMLSPSAPYYAEKLSPRDPIYSSRVHFSAPC
jgi:hypothetical protein